MRRVVLTIVCAADASAAGWAAADDIRRASGYYRITGPYVAKVVSYRANFRSRHPIVEVQFPSLKAFTFESHKGFRFELFAIGQSVKLVQKQSSLGAGLSSTIIYEIDDSIHRFGTTILILAVGLLSVAVAFIQLRFPESKRPTKQVEEHGNIAPH
ncbi:MAG: hypothetical protein ABIQ12_05880 [Opitutaceae bacterium]